MAPRSHIDPGSVFFDFGVTKASTMAEIYYLVHDFNFLAELKYEKPSDFNRVERAFLIQTT